MPPRKPRNPVPTVDIIIEIVTRREGRRIIIVRRKNPPFGWALPGGFVEYGESLEQAAVREAREETSLDVRLLGQFHTYSDPRRDPRLHTVSTVFVARARGTPEAGDDAGDVRVIDPRKIDFPLAFDHRKILEDYAACRRGHCPWAKMKAKKRRLTRARTRI